MEVFKARRSEESDETTRGASDAFRESMTQKARKKGNAPEDVTVGGVLSGKARDT